MGCHAAWLRTSGGSKGAIILLIKDAFADLSVATCSTEITSMSGPTSQVPTKAKLVIKAPDEYQSQGKGSNLKGAILDQMMPKSMDFNRFSLIFDGFGWIWIWIWIWMDLNGFGWICIPSSVFCVVQPCRGLFFIKNTSLVLLQPRTVFLAFY